MEFWLNVTAPIDLVFLRFLSKVSKKKKKDTVSYLQNTKKQMEKSLSKIWQLKIQIFVCRASDIFVRDSVGSLLTVKYIEKRAAATCDSRWISKVWKPYGNHLEIR